MKAFGLYTKYDAPAFSQNFNIYRRIALEIFSMPGLDNADAFTTWKQLRTMFSKLVRIFLKLLGDCEAPLLFLLRISEYGSF